MGTRPYVIAITGGIGSGKSVVSRIVTAMGHPVYDCDSRAKWLMDSSEEIKASIAGSIDSTCIKEGAIDRPALAAIVFESEEKLNRLNTIVHGAVRKHLAEWIDGEADAGNDICFVETAILYQSGLDAMADEVWMVDAPLDLRISRVMNRNGLTREAVLARISSQDSFIPSVPHSNIKIIINDGDTPLLPRVEELLPAT